MPGESRRPRLALVVALGLALLALVAGATVVLVRHDGAPPVPAAAPKVLPSRAALLVPLGPDGLGSGALLPAPPAVAAALTDRLAAPALGGQVAAAAVDVATGTPLLDHGATRLATPASTTKIMTGLAALSTLPADKTLATRVVRGAVPGDLVLVGGGDPTLSSPGAGPPPPADPDEPAEPDLNQRHAQLGDLAAAVARARASDPVPVDRLLVDATLYAGPTLGPGWSPSYVSSGNVAPVTALMVDEGRARPDRRARVDEPPLAAGRELAALLRVAGVPGALAVTSGTAPPAPVEELARVESPPVPDLVEEMLRRSDNDLAEALARQVALAAGQPASFAGGAAAVRQAVLRLGVPADGVDLVDGSGLSRTDRLSPLALTRGLTLAARPDRPALHPLLTGLPVAGFSGTLGGRYRSGASTAAGDVRAKTGTLNGVNALAGTVVDADGRLLAFAFLADSVPFGGVGPAEAALDRAAAALAACGCP